MGRELPGPGARGKNFPGAHLPGQLKGVQTGTSWLSPSSFLHRDAHGVYQLAVLLMELDREDEASGLLAADALYRLGRLEDTHKALLLALSRRPQAAPVLVRLTLLQLRRGFLYDANQVRRPGGGRCSMAGDGPQPWGGHRPLGPSLCTPQPGLWSRSILSQPQALPPPTRPPSLP